MIVRLQLISGFYCVNLRKSKDPQLFQFLFMQIQNENGNNDQSKDHKDLRVEIRTIRSKLSVAAFRRKNSSAGRPLTSARKAADRCKNLLNIFKGLMSFNDSC